MKELPPIVQTHPAYSKDQRHRLAPSNDNVWICYVVFLNHSERLITYLILHA
jgi:hypothetical protein